MTIAKRVSDAYLAKTQSIASLQADPLDL